MEMAAATLAAATTTIKGAPAICSCGYHRHPPVRPAYRGGGRKLGGGPSIFQNKERLIPVKASNSPGSEEEGSGVEDAGGGGLSKEDLNFLWKLGGGSVAGAAIIKYGSVLFPEITRPNLFQALLMVSTPVIIATVLLIKQSRSP